MLPAAQKPNRRRWGSPVPIPDTLKKKRKKKKEDPPPPPEPPKKKRKKKGERSMYHQDPTYYLYEANKEGDIRFVDSHDPCEVNEIGHCILKKSHMDIDEEDYEKRDKSRCYIRRL